MIIYLYDGSFHGLLTAIYQAYYLRHKPDQIFVAEDYRENLLDHTIEIITDSEKADKVYDSIRKKISSRALKNIYYVFLSEDPGAATIIYQYLRLGWKLGSAIDEHLTDEKVMGVHNLYQKVSRERHRMTGLIRFQQLRENFYYSRIEPDYNIVGLVAPHFVQRMGDQEWIIHDVKRGIAAICYQQQWVLSELDSGFIPPIGQEELQYQELWRQYFNNISIEERKNPKLQKNNMPRRYWKNLTEK